MSKDDPKPASNQPKPSTDSVLSTRPGSGKLLYDQYPGLGRSRPSPPPKPEKKK